MDFIKAGTPQPSRQPMRAEVVPTPVTEHQPPRPVVADTAPAALTSDPIEAERVVAKPAKPRVLREPEPESLPPRNLVTLSIRVRPEIPDALLRASTERKLKRLKAHRQQDIAAEALTQWLARNGYLAS